MELSEKVQSFCIALLSVQMQFCKTGCSFNAISLSQGQSYFKKFKTLSV